LLSLQAAANPEIELPILEISNPRFFLKQDKDIDMQKIQGVLAAALVGSIAITGCADLEPPDGEIAGSEAEAAFDAAAVEGLGAFMIEGPPQSSAAAAAREPNPPGCDPGAFCAYSGQNVNGRLLLERQGNWSGSLSGVGSVYNNGVAFPGADHVYVRYFIGNLLGTLCLHYNPGPGHRFFFSPSARLVSATWGPECPTK
jgi:hypothetical protein